jgi:putative nucleotidyltransferase with HDIG domain
MVLYRVLAMQEVMSDQGLMRLLSQVESLPAMPQIYADLLTAVESESTSLEKIGAIIEQDMGMSATILKVVNSAFFGLPRHIEKPAQAVGLLGLDVIKSLVLSCQVFSYFDTKGIKGISFNLLWEHSVNTACLAKTVAEAEKEKPEQVDEAFIGGMLHDVGKLPLIALTTEKYKQVLKTVRAENRLVWDVELELLGTSHSKVGAYLMGLWGMSEEVINALAFHHKPSDLRIQSFGTVSAVHVANVMEHELVVFHEDYARPQIDLEHLAHIGKEDRLPVWREKCLSCLKTRGAKC